MTSLQALTEEMQQTFSSEPFQGISAAHDCPECDEIRNYLAGKSWRDLDEEHLFSIALPLLTPEGYRAFLPAWLWHGLHDPQSSPADLALINMEHARHAKVFSPGERALLVRCAQYINSRDPFAREDQESIDRLRQIQRLWS